jgi:hypothetical protein
MLSSSSISIPRFDEPPVLKTSSSKIFNTSNARIPKTVAVEKRFAVRNGSIGGIKPMKKTLNLQKILEHVLPGRPPHRCKHRFSRLIDQENKKIKASVIGKNMRCSVR